MKQIRSIDIVAFVTTNKDRLLGGKQLSLLASDEQEGQKLSEEIARAMHAELMQLSNGDFLVVK